MSIDTIIIFLLVAIALVAVLILLKGGSEKKVYDPNDVDLGNAFDPKHDHFSKGHVEKLKELKNKKSTPVRKAARAPIPVAARKPRSETHSEFEGLEHLKKPVDVESPQDQDESSGLGNVNRRTGETRRHGERRTEKDRRG